MAQIAFADPSSKFKGSLRLSSRADAQAAMQQGREKDVQSHWARGQLLVRERVELLLDADSTFLELMPLAGFEQDGCPVGAGLVAGIGVVGYVFQLLKRALKPQRCRMHDHSQCGDAEWWRNQ